MSEKLVAQRVNEFIKKRKPAAICDLCIVRGVRLRRRAHANQITAALATTSEFVRTKGRCQMCKQSDIMVIKAVDLQNTATEPSVLNFKSIVVEFGNIKVRLVR
jgi:hypothetical protein